MGAAGGTEPASSATATFPGPQRVPVLPQRKWGMMPVGRSWGQRGHQSYAALVSWPHGDVLEHKIYAGLQRLAMKKMGVKYPINLLY